MTAHCRFGQCYSSAVSTTGYTTALLLLALDGGQQLQRSTQRMIDRCAQDGGYFYAWEDDLTKPVQVERDGVTVRIDRPNVKNQNEAVFTFSREAHQFIERENDFEGAEGWLTVSESGAFAVTWNLNASVTSTELFTIEGDGEIVADKMMISSAERIFQKDAKRFCANPGVNTTAVKWMDKDHLLVAINAWSSGFCYSNFTEGFIIDVTANRISRKLTERELLDLPAVCTWNIVPIKQH